MIFLTSSWRRPSGTFRSAQDAQPAGRVAGRDRQRLDVDRPADPAVGYSGRNRADDQQQRICGIRDQRPNLIGDPELPADERSVARWFNTSAFAAAPQFTIGCSSRNPVRGPGYRNLDLAVLRRIALRRGSALEVRAEIFNLTNTPPFGAPNTTVGSAAFGTITTLAIRGSFNWQ